MNKKKWTVTLAAVLLVILTATGYAAISAQYGSSDDPLVTKSYIEDVLRPSVMQDIDNAFNSKKAEFDAEAAQKLAEAKDAIDRQVAEIQNSLTSSDAVQRLAAAVSEQVLAGISGQPGAPAAEWKVVTLASGQTVTCEVGCQIILRLGAASCVSQGTVGLVDLSDGTVIGQGQNLSQNHLYIVTIAGRGILSSGQSTVLIKGSYTVK